MKRAANGDDTSRLGHSKKRRLIDSFRKLNLRKPESSKVEKPSKYDKTKELLENKKLFIPKKFLDPMFLAGRDNIDEKMKQFYFDQMRASKVKVADSEEYDSDLDSMDIDEDNKFNAPEQRTSNSEIYYKMYLLKYFSLIKYYDPWTVIYEVFKRWWDDKISGRLDGRIEVVDSGDEEGDIVLSD